MQTYNNHSNVGGGGGGGLQYHLLLSLCCKNNRACLNEVALPYHNANIHLKLYENLESAEMPYKPLSKILVTGCAGYCHSINRVSGCTSYFKHT